MKTNGATLVTHRGAIRVGREDLTQFNPPERTDTWTPIKHSELVVEALHEELVRRDLLIKHEQYAVQKQGNILFGTLDLDWQDNGEYAAKRNHTAGLNLPTELAGALDRYQEGVLTLHRGIDHLKNTPLTLPQAKEIVFDIFRQRIMPLRLFHAVADSYPTKQGGRSSSRKAPKFGMSRLSDGGFVPFLSKSEKVTGLQASGKTLAICCIEMIWSLLGDIAASVL